MFPSTLPGLVCFAENCVTSHKFCTVQDRRLFWSFTAKAHPRTRPAFLEIFVSSTDVSCSSKYIILLAVYENYSRNSYQKRTYNTSQLPSVKYSSPVVLIIKILRILSFFKKNSFMYKSMPLASILLLCLGFLFEK